MKVLLRCVHIARAVQGCSSCGSVAMAAHHCIRARPPCRRGCMTRRGRRGCAGRTPRQRSKPRRCRRTGPPCSGRRCTRGRRPCKQRRRSSTARSATHRRRLGKAPGRGIRELLLRTSSAQMRAVSATKCVDLCGPRQQRGSKQGTGGTSGMGGLCASLGCLRET